MPRTYECPNFIQSQEKGASLGMRDACLKCGRTKHAHDLDKLNTVPSDQLAAEWLEEAGYLGRPYFDLVRGILSKYIGEHR